ncbi:MAG TPA: hypothetical protein VH877_33090 [Polyangia bacterium]|jgi:hypothetical protein|nr:hypothetical protein [Polyangia bacterium]
MSSSVDDAPPASPPGRPPHPATVPRGAAAQPKVTGAARGPHPATEPRKTAAQRKTPKAPAPHPATVARGGAAQPEKAGGARGAHPATLPRGAAAQPKKAGPARAPHPATAAPRPSDRLPMSHGGPTGGMAQRSQVAKKGGKGKGWDKETLLDNLEATVGQKWVNYITKDLEAIVVYEGPGLYDSTQRVVFINSAQTESDATQQLVMELSNHQNRSIFNDLDQSVNRMGRDAYIEAVEHLEFAGVTNVIRTYDAAVELGLKWAQGGCVYGAMRNLSFAQYYQHVDQEHRERYGRRYDALK